MTRLFLGLALLVSLAACGAQSVWAPDSIVSRVRYREPGPATLTLFTVINNDNGGGGHTSLMINASQRVIFDPAGTWTDPMAPERNDVHFGITDAVLDRYIDYHTRHVWRTVQQTVVVPPELAEKALRLVDRNGAAPKAFCAETVSGILDRLPGFQGLPRTFFPVRLMRAFAQLPGVKTRTYFDNDPNDNVGKIVRYTDLTPAQAAKLGIIKP